MNRKLYIDVLILIFVLLFVAYNYRGKCNSSQEFKSPLISGSICSNYEFDRGDIVMIIFNSLD